MFFLINVNAVFSSIKTTLFKAQFYLFFPVFLSQEKKNNIKKKQAAKKKVKQNKSFC